MFKSNSRIESFKGIRFYEQDVLFDNYLYNSDIQITMDAKYISPGIGIALINNEGLSTEDNNEIYMFKCGYRDSNVIYAFGSVQKVLFTSATNLMPPVEDIVMHFTKRGKRVTLSIDGYGTLIDFMLPIDIDKFNIGVYSNAGNIIKSVSVASSVPDGWLVNMHNTNGGYLTFNKNGFTLSNCENDAEIEQQNIFLKAGTYYFRYTNSISSDIKAYVIASGDERLKDEDKNILGSNGTFVLAKDSSINIKFKGQAGTISNIHITDNVGDGYVATKDSQATVEGSYITIDLEDIKQIQWVGVIKDVPYAATQDQRSAIMIRGQEAVTNSDASVLITKEYTYTFFVADNKLEVTSNNTLVKTIQLTDLDTKVILFKNMDSIIKQLTLIQTDGQVINLIAIKTSKKYVPASIASPIVVTDDNGVPLDLSSSFRAYTDNGCLRFLFTNFEREIFEPSNKLKLSKKVSMDIGSVKVYGIPKTSQYDMNYIFHIPYAGLDTINMFCQKYETLYEEDLHYVDKNKGEIYINDVSKYQMLVVDYLKRDSYCINFVEDMQMYEIDISSAATSPSLIYDHIDSTAEGKDITTITNYKVTDISPDNKCYIVLRREGF